MAEKPAGLESVGLPYNPAECVLEVNGKRWFKWMNFNADRVNPLNSWAPSSADGGHLIIHHADLQGTFSIELQQNSPSVADALKLVPMLQPFSVVIKDKSGTPDLATMTEALLARPPQLQRAQGESNYRIEIIGVLRRAGGQVPQS